MGVFECDEGGVALPDYNSITRHGLQVGLNSQILNTLNTDHCTIIRGK
jgi:hypothetical protein